MTVSTVQVTSAVFQNTQPTGARSMHLAKGWLKGRYDAGWLKTVSFQRLRASERHFDTAACWSRGLSSSSSACSAFTGNTWMWVSSTPTHLQMISITMIWPKLGADLFWFCRFSWTLVRICPALSCVMTLHHASQPTWRFYTLYSFHCSRFVVLLYEFISFPYCSLFLADINYGEYSTDAPVTIFDLGDWLFDLLDVVPSSPDVCDPNPCFNGASCQMKSATEFTCLCVEPYGGKKCQTGQKIHR